MARTIGGGPPPPIRIDAPGSHEAMEARDALSQAGRRIGGRRKLAGGLGRRRIRGHFRGSRDGYPDTKVPVEMVFAACRAISLTRVLITKTGEFIAATHTVAVAGFRSSLDRYKWHGFLSDDKKRMAWSGIGRKAGCHRTGITKVLVGKGARSDGS